MHIFMYYKFGHYKKLMGLLKKKKQDRNDLKQKE